jgi:hypothetical protein
MGGEDGDEYLTKKCAKCKATKLRACDFHRSARAADGLRSRCKECEGEDQRIRVANNPAARAASSRAYALKSRYDISVSEYDRLLALQGGKCAICGRPPGRVRLAVDHDHKSGAVRGLLCGRAPKRNCNQGLGYFSDSPERLRAAADYLELPPTQRLDWRDV